MNGLCFETHSIHLDSVSNWIQTTIYHNDEIVWKVSSQIGMGFCLSAMHIAF